MRWIRRPTASASASEPKTTAYVASRVPCRRRNGLDWKSLWSATPWATAGWASCRSNARPAARNSAGSAFTRRTTESLGKRSATSATVLQLHDHLEVPLGSDVAGRLDPSPPHLRHHARHDVGFEVVPVGALGVGLGHDRDPVAPYLHEQVIEIVPVHLALLARGQPQLPYPDPVVLEQKLRPHTPQCSLIGHGRIIADRDPSPPERDAGLLRGGLDDPEKTVGVA